MWSKIKIVTLNVWAKEIVLPTGNYSPTMKIVIGALLSSIAFILQSAGVFTGFGYLLSMMSTLPIVLATLLSIKIGMMTYVITVFLLAMLQPTEVFIFTFTTGLLGISLGISLNYLKRVLFVVLFTALCLTLGICTVLYGFKFAILGPSVTSHFNSLVTLGIFTFSLLYSWIWLKVMTSFFKLFNNILSR